MKNVDYPAKRWKPSMKDPDSDPRVIRTRTQLRNAMMNLAAEKNFASLTVQDVTDRAGLNRTTFYLHYSGLHELLEDCARELFSRMRAEIYANKVSGILQNTASLEPFVESVFHHLESHEKFYRSMLGKQGDPFFRSLFQDLLSELIFEPIANEIPGVDPDLPYGMTLRFFSAGFTGIAAWWLENGMPVSPEEASRQIARDILPGYIRFMGRP
jgi:AcrR family transcriptional regulator